MFFFYPISMLSSGFYCFDVFHSRVSCGLLQLGLERDLAVFTSGVFPKYLRGKMKRRSGHNSIRLHKMAPWGWELKAINKFLCNHQNLCMNIVQF